MWTLEDEQALREDLIEKIISKVNEGDGMLSRSELGSFNYAGQTIRVIDSQGWNPGDICALTTGSRHEIQRKEGDGALSRPYWKKYFEQDAIYHCTTSGFKGLERRVVVLAMNGWKEEERKKDILYTAVTRARDVLVICGSKEGITQVGGKEFFKKLTRSAP